MGKKLHEYISHQFYKLKVILGLSLDPIAKEEKAVASVVHESIPTSKFLAVLKQKKSEKRLNIEVRAIVRNQEDFSCSIAQETHNSLMNVRQEVVTYDHSRVILYDVPKGWNNDYVNASYVDGYSISKEYIASQGPNSRSIIQFWHMIWQEGIHCIVMATGLFENAVQQCDKYWEDYSGVKKYVQHGSIHIWTEASVHLAHLNIRTFRIQKEGSYNCRIIRQFEMVGFHDNECADPGYILDVRRRVNHFMSTSLGPILVHCRCGGGRTAVFLAIDYCLKQVETEDKVDIYGAVLHLRRYRKNMVRTLGQYGLIYDTVAMYINCNYTVFPVADLHFQTPVDFTNSRSPQIDQEFQVLQYIVPALSIGDCASGHRVENRCKSRDIMMLPPERARPYLSADTNDNGNDFINAVYVDGLFNVNAYLVTQWPKKNTLNDIWRLLFDYKINSLVVLNDLKFTRRFQKFWPKELDEECRYGPISVRYLGCGKYPELIIRAFAIHKILPNNQREPKDSDLIVKMFQATNGMSPAKITMSHKSLLYIMQCVDDWQQKTNPSTPVCILSKDGCNRCGIYTAVNICCNQVKIDGECDIFNAVRIIKRNRPHLVSTIDEYRYIYYFMAEYISETSLQPQIVITKATGNTTTMDYITPTEDSVLSVRSSRSASFQTALDEIGDYILPCGFDNKNSLSAYIAQIPPLSTKNCILSLSRASSVDSVNIYETPLNENLDDSVFYQNSIPPECLSENSKATQTSKTMINQARVLNQETSQTPSSSRQQNRQNSPHHESILLHEMPKTVVEKKNNNLNQKEIEEASEETCSKLSNGTALHLTDLDSSKNG